jgi:hypothetical protein
LLDNNKTFTLDVTGFVPDVPTPQASEKAEEAVDKVETPPP